MTGECIPGPHVTAFFPLAEWNNSTAKKGKTISELFIRTFLFPNPKVKVYVAEKDQVGGLHYLLCRESISTDIADKLGIDLIIRTTNLNLHSQFFEVQWG